MQELEKVPTNTPVGKHAVTLTTSGSDEAETAICFVSKTFCTTAIKMLHHYLIYRFDTLHISTAPQCTVVVTAEGRGGGPGGHKPLR